MATHDDLKRYYESHGLKVPDPTPRPTLRVTERPILYVAGPMTTGGDPYRNLGLGYAAAHEALRLGWAPYVPHSDAVWNAMLGFAGLEPVTYTEWLDLDLVFIRAAHSLLRLPGQSHGVNAVEVPFAEALGKPVYTRDTLPRVVYDHDPIPFPK